METLGEARQRAAEAGSLAEAIAQTEGPVLIVAHGLSNALIAAALRRNGWSGRRRPRSRHWSTTTYAR